MARLLFFIGVILICLVIEFNACYSPNTATRVLTNDGYTDIQIHGYGFLQCDASDSYATTFTAKKNGKVITGSVCSGIFKNNTIRVD